MFARAGTRCRGRRCRVHPYLDPPPTSSLCWRGGGPVDAAEVGIASALSGAGYWPAQTNGRSFHVGDAPNPGTLTSLLSMGLWPIGVTDSAEQKRQLPVHPKQTQHGRPPS